MKSSQQDWQAYRRRMLRETEKFIEYGLAHPEFVIGIPARPVGDGGFPRGVADWFWSAVLTGRGSGRLAEWREKLRGRRWVPVGRKRQ